MVESKSNRPTSGEERKIPGRTWPDWHPVLANFRYSDKFEGGYWARKSEWDPLRAAMEGSSFYDLPFVPRWFSSNIGYHHVHHLSPRIPNYHLKKCFDTIPALQTKAPLPIMKSFSFIRLKVWDEERQRMVAFP